MKCDKCNKPATSTIQNVMDGYFGEIEQHLCQEHTKKEIEAMNNGSQEDYKNANLGDGMFFTR
jgi:hypothetical protein